MLLKKTFIPLALSFGLVGCSYAPKRWVATDVISRPKVLSVHFADIKVENTSDLKGDLGIGPKELKELIKPYVADSIKKIQNVDNVVWVDSIPLAPEKIYVQLDTLLFDKPAQTGGDGWLLTLSSPSTYRTNESSGTTYSQQALNIQVRYLLTDLKTGNRLAYGVVEGKSYFKLYMDQSDWIKASRSLGSWLGYSLPFPKKPAP